MVYSIVSSKLFRLFDGEVHRRYWKGFHAILINLKILRYVPGLTRLGVSGSPITERIWGIVGGDLSGITESKPKCKSSSRSNTGNGTEDISMGHHYIKIEHTGYLGLLGTIQAYLSTPSVKNGKDRGQVTTGFTWDGRRHICRRGVWKTSLFCDR